MKKTALFFILFVNVLTLSAQKAETEVDICVYGGNAAGVITAYTAQKAGKSVILIEPGNHLGGLTTGGLGYTDIGNKFAITGIARDFYRRIGKHYGKFEQWIFEPHVAENILLDYIKRAQVKVLYGHRLNSLKKQGKVIQEITLENSKNPSMTTNRKIRAKMFIDCTYEGDLMAKAKVSYTVGREDNQTFHETYNGVQLMEKHQFPDGIDPYKIEGKPESGLVWGVSDEKLLPAGTGNKNVQAYNFRICLTKDVSNQIPIGKPEGYDSTKYELLLRVFNKMKPKNLAQYLKFDFMPNQKTDINNNGPFSTDMIGMNYEFPEADYQKRAEIQKNHELYIKGLLYFIGNDARIEEHLRKEMKSYGYPKDEYTDNGNWSPQMYVREARRMVGAYVMTQANCQGKEVVTDGVGMAAYTMDSHNCQRLVIEKNGVKMVKNEGDVQVGGFPPYPISYRSLIPKASEVSNLLVPVCMSASHIAYGSIRMEPVFMVLGQSSALAASLAIDHHTSVQEIEIGKLQKMLKTDPLSDGSIAEILVDDANTGNVKLIGSWEKETTNRGAYGSSMLSDESKGKEEKSVRFIPEIVKNGKYQVYVYVPKVQQSTSKTLVTVFDGKGMNEVNIDHTKLVVEGQTSGEWVGLGAYTFPKGNQSFVEISNKSADGKVVADAVLFVPAE